MQIALNIFEAEFFKAKEWVTQVPRRPFWRLYWNQTSGAEIFFQGENMSITPDCITLIAPQTYYKPILVQPCWHFFVHFTFTGFYDHNKVSIFQFNDKQLIKEIDNLCKKQKMKVDLLSEEHGMLLPKIILQALSHLPREFQLGKKQDLLHQKIHEEVDSFSDNPESIQVLAKKAGMSERSFHRHFKEVMGITPQAFFLLKRLDKACLQLEFSDQSIDDIAKDCGFCDRNYFSAIFKKKFNIPPATYRRQCRM